MSAPSISILSRTLMSIQQRASFASSVFCLIFGVTGCLLNILLFSRRQFRGVSCCTYLLAASVATFVQLGFSAGTNMYSSYFEIPINNSPAFCKLWFYLLQSTSILYRWLLGAACLDRYTLSSTSARLRSLASVQNARRVVATNIGISIVFPVHILVLYDAQRRSCNIYNNHTGSLYTAIISIINTGLIPVSVMIICTLLIRTNLADKRKRRHGLTHQQAATNGKEQIQRKRDHQALKMLFVQIIVFIIIITPWLVYNIYSAISLGVPNKSLDVIILEGFLSFVTGTFALLFAAISFYLYTLTSSLFRGELLVILRCLLCCKYFINHHRVEPIVTAKVHRAIAVQ